MSKSFRIRTTPGEDYGYLKVNVDLKQYGELVALVGIVLTKIDEESPF